MKKLSPYLLLAVGCLLLAIGFITVMAFIDRPPAPAQEVLFIDEAGDRLAGTYSAGQQPWGVLLLEGFGSDQITMTSLASQFQGAGWHVFRFDFSGHGRSPGTLTFDNASTDRLARQALSALEEYSRLSGLRPDQVFVLGHSLGARVALQSATLNPSPVAGLVLLGTQVNLSTNVQSEFFTGTSDGDLPWVQALGPQNPPVPILLVSGTWDDILTPAAAEQLFSRLTASNYQQAEGVFQSEGEGAPRQQWILPALVHNYEPFSPRVLQTLQQWLTGRTSTVFPGPGPARLRVVTWIAALAAMLLGLWSANKWWIQTHPGQSTPPPIAITHLRRFLWGKMWLWLAALPVAAVLGSLFFVLPVGKPVFNLIYVGFIGGYGLLLFVLYRRGKMPGVQGKFNLAARAPAALPAARKDVRHLLAVLVISAAMLILTGAYARSGWFYTFPLNIRLLWLVIFTPFTALGFWIGLQEARMLPAAGSSRLLVNLIGLLPFFLYTLLMAVIGSLSGMIGGLQGLLILWLVLLFGSLIQSVGRWPWLTAFCMAVLLYWLILPQGVLFG